MLAFPLTVLKCLCSLHLVFWLLCEQNFFSVQIYLVVCRLLIHLWPFVLLGLGCFLPWFYWRCFLAIRAGILQPLLFLLFLHLIFSFCLQFPGYTGLETFNSLYFFWWMGQYCLWHPLSQKYFLLSLVISWWCSNL